MGPSVFSKRPYPLLSPVSGPVVTTQGSPGLRSKKGLYVSTRPETGRDGDKGTRSSGTDGTPSASGSLTTGPFGITPHLER